MELSNNSEGTLLHWMNTLWGYSVNCEMSLSKLVYYVTITFTVYMHQILLETCICVHGNYLNKLFEKVFYRWFNEWSLDKLLVPPFQTWVKICWKQSTLWKDFCKQNTPKCWMQVGDNQRKLVVNSARTERGLEITWRRFHNANKITKNTTGQLMVIHQKKFWDYFEKWKGCEVNMWDLKESIFKMTKMPLL